MPGGRVAGLRHARHANVFDLMPRSSCLTPMLPPTPHTQPARSSYKDYQRLELDHGIQAYEQEPRKLPKRT
eukprot:11203537-Lingulodinium_polyedra.AAC.1